MPEAANNAKEYIKHHPATQERFNKVVKRCRRYLQTRGIGQLVQSHFPETLLMHEKTSDRSELMEEF
jgi:hypothetical protein